MELDGIGSSSSSHLFHIVDDFYFSALHDDDQIFPISDEKYAEELQLQEALISSSTATVINASSSSSSTATVINASSSSSSTATVISSSTATVINASSSSTATVINASSSSTATVPSPCNQNAKKKQPMDHEETSSDNFCEICMDTKTSSEMFRNTNVCGHLYCFDCIREHIAAKIKENITMVKCPHPNCKGVIGPELCRSIIPKQVLERWENSLCESLILASEKFYCPFKDCSAMLVDDGTGEAFTSSECPNCNRLFCAKCKVVWHSGMDCNEFQTLNKDERDPEDVMLMELAKRKQWRRCPSCKFFVEKLQGCLHISCRCGFDFCYGCGKQYEGIGTHVCRIA